MCSNFYFVRRVNTSIKTFIFVNALFVLTIYHSKAIFTRVPQVYIYCKTGTHYISFYFVRMIDQEIVKKIIKALYS